MKVLVIEDDSTVGQFVKRGLEQQRSGVDLVADGIEGEPTAMSRNYDLVILNTCEVMRAEVPIELAPKEYTVHEYLMRHVGRARDARFRLALVRAAVRPTGVGVPSEVYHRAHEQFTEKELPGSTRREWADDERCHAKSSVSPPANGHDSSTTELMRRYVQSQTQKRQ